MFQILLVEKVCSIGMFCFFMVSMAILMFLALKYNYFIKEAENMSITKQKELKAIKTKFLNSYSKNETEDEKKYAPDEQVNVEVFVDKAVNRLKISGLKSHTWRFLAAQAIVVSIIFISAGIFRSLSLGVSFSELFSFYLIAFLELYIYFSVVSILDFDGKEKFLRLTIIEYIENHLVNRIRVANAFQMEENVIRALEQEQSKKNNFSKEMEQELDDLLKDFLV